jgi:hypothetical protein
MSMLYICALLLLLNRNGHGHHTNALDPHLRNKVTYVSKLREAFSRIDPKKPRGEVNKLLVRGCGSASIEEMLHLESSLTLIHIADFQQRLQTGLIKKTLR